MAKKTPQIPTLSTNINAFLVESGIGKPGVRVSFLRRRYAPGAPRDIRKAVNHLRNVVVDINKLQEKIFKTHEVKSAVDLQNKLITDLGFTIEEVVKSIDKATKVAYDIIKQALPKMLALRYLQGKPFRSNIPLSAGKLSETALASEVTPLRTGLGSLTKWREARETGRAMLKTHKVFDHIEKIRSKQKHLSEQNYNALLTKLSARGVKFSGEEKKELKSFSEEEKLIKDFGAAVYYLSAEINDLMFLESRIDRVSRMLAEIDVRAANPQNRLLPPANIREFATKMANYLTPFLGCVVAVERRLDYYQKQLQGLKAYKKRFGRYDGFIGEVLANFEAQLNKATIRHGPGSGGLQDKITYAILKFKGLARIS